MGQKPQRIYINLFLWALVIDVAILISLGNSVPLLVVLISRLSVLKYSFIIFIALFISKSLQENTSKEKYSFSGKVWILIWLSAIITNPDIPQSSGLSHHHTWKHKVALF